MTPVGAEDFDTVLVVDFGAQYAQLIARRVREARVYSEIVPHTMPVADLLAKRPKAIILSGGPSSVYAEGAPQVSSDVFTAGVPVFGMCYGFQAMAQSLGGEVRRTCRSGRPRKSMPGVRTDSEAPPNSDSPVGVTTPPSTSAIAWKP